MTDDERSAIVHDAIAGRTLQVHLAGPGTAMVAVEIDVAADLSVAGMRSWAFTIEEQLAGYLAGADTPGGTP